MLWTNQVRCYADESCALFHSFEGYIILIVQLSGINTSNSKFPWPSLNRERYRILWYCVLDLQVSESVYTVWWGHLKSEMFQTHWWVSSGEVGDRGSTAQVLCFLTGDVSLDAGGKCLHVWGEGVKWRDVLSLYMSVIVASVDRFTTNSNTHTHTLCMCVCVCVCVYVCVCVCVRHKF